MEWAEFILSDEFAAYRKKQAEVIAKTVHGMLCNFRETDGPRLAGVMDMAFKLVRLPQQLLPMQSSILEQVGIQIDQDMADVSAYLIKRSFTSSDEDD